MRQAALVVLFFAHTALAACSSPSSDSFNQDAAHLRWRAPQPQRTDYDVEIEMSRGSVSRRSYRVVEQRPRTFDVPYTKEERTPPRQPEKVARTLLERISSGSNDLVTVLVTCRTSVRYRKAAGLERTQSRSAEANVAILRQRADERELVNAMRSAERAHVKSLISAIGGRIEQEFNFGSVIVTRLPLRMVSELSQHEGVEHVSLDEAAPPPTTTIQAGRTKLNSDSWFSLGYNGLGTFGLYTALVDTGVMSSHLVFTASGGGSLAYMRDCANGDNVCLNSAANPNYNTQDPWWGHGTAMANIIIGGNASGPLDATYRGVSRVELDSYNTADHADANSDGNRASLDSAVLKGMSVARDNGADIIVVINQNQGASNGALAAAADDLYDDGAVVLASNGNVGQVSWIGGVAIARNALGIGQFDIDSNSTSRTVVGNDLDGRSKPDLFAPDNVWAALGGTTTNNRVIAASGTSPATAFAGGAATIFYDLHETLGYSLDPGIIYATMLAQGEDQTFQMGVGRIL